MFDIGKTLRKVLRKPITLSDDETLIEIETMIFQDKLDQVIQRLDQYEKDGFQSSELQEINFKKHFCTFLRSRAYVDMGKANESIEILENSMEVIKDTNNPVLVNLSKIEYGNALLAGGKIPESWDILDQAEQEVNGLKLFYNNDYKSNQARVNNLQSKVYLRKGDFREAIREQNESIDLYEKIGKQYHTAEPLNGLGVSYASIGESDRALHYLSLSSHIYEKLENQSQLLKIYNNTGMIYWLGGKHSQALDNFQKALDISQQKRNKQASAMILLNLGLIYIDQGQIAKSQKNFEESMTLFEELGNRPSIAKCQFNLSNIYKLYGELDKSIEYLELCLAYYQEIDNKDELAKTYANMGGLYIELRKDHKAIKLLTQSLEIHEASGNILAMVQPLNGLIEANIALNNMPEAEISLKKFEEVKELHSDNKSVQHQYKLANAKILIESDRVVKRAEAQKLFTEIADDEVVSQQHTTEAMLRLGELLLQELKLSASEDALNEFKDLIDRLDKVARSEGTQSVEQTPTIVQVLMLQSKLALIDLDVKKSQTLLDEGYDLANKNGLMQLAQIIDGERETYKKEMMKYKKMVETNASLYERLQQSQIENYLKRAESILKR
ncbi:MAG: Photosystem I assembly protein Ycf3 [Candidatus Heimdallarchaeota archaeon LC_2]|nr:MAG: Photosystem I assembly protein Ycf3 [Candidatus Heimdallarchaeota archaeon LC_2]